MNQLTKLVKRFLNKIKSTESYELLDTLITELEETCDPDSIDIYLLETLYQFKEKLKITESKLSSYLIQKRKKTSGDKLDELYDRISGYGTTTLFE